MFTPGFCFGVHYVSNRFSFPFCVFALFVFVLYLVYPMLSMFLDCPFLLTPSVFSNVYLITTVCTVSFVPNVTSVSGLSILIAPWVFSNVY